MNRLDGQWPHVAAALAALPVQEQLVVARRAVALALAATEQPAPEGDQAAIEAEVGRLDTAAWDIQNDDAASPEVHDLAFRRARAANAYLIASSSGDLEEVLYEALHALGAPTDGGFLFEEQVTSIYEEFVFPEPWQDLRGDGYGEQRDRLVRRLLIELGGEHALAARGFEAVATFTRQDEVLYRIDQGREFLIAHLTYTSTPPDPFVGLRIFSSWQDTAAMVHEMAEMW